jgi:hypothetical protein
MDQTKLRVNTLLNYFSQSINCAYILCLQCVPAHSCQFSIRLKIILGNQLAYMYYIACYVLHGNEARTWLDAAQDAA